MSVVAAMKSDSLVFELVQGRVKLAASRLGWQILRCLTEL
jgi:hypothetical protein